MLGPNSAQSPKFNVTVPDVPPVAVSIPLGPSGYLALAAGLLPVHHSDTSPPLARWDRLGSGNEASGIPSFGAPHSQFGKF